MTEVVTKEWKPSRKQADFISLPDSVSEGFYGGAAGGGKSEVLLMLPIAKEWYKNPHFKGLLLRRTFPELEKSLITRSEEWYQHTGAIYNRQLKRWKWPWGAYLDFGYAEYEKDVRRYDTTEYTYIGFDELTSFTEFQYLYLTKSRLRSSDPDLPAIARSASNPGNIGHGWVRKRFVEPAREGGVLLRDGPTGQLRIFIKSLLTDNPYLMAADPGYIDRLRQLPEAERRAKLDGDWWTFSGQVFDDWRSEHFPDEPENALHVIAPFTVPDWWPKVLAIDWGFSAMLWAGWAAASPQGQCILYREYTCKQTKISTWATDIGRVSQGADKPRLTVVDPSAWHHNGSEKNIADQFYEHSGLSPLKADNDRVGGKVLMQEYLRWQPRPPRTEPRKDFDPDLAAYIMRMKGLEAYKSYLDMYKPEPPEGPLPKLQVFNTCPEFIKAIPLCVYDETNKEDVAEFDGDDPYDGGRYLIKAVDRYFKESEGEFKKIQQREQVVNSCTDMTSYYRRMEQLEARERHVKRGVPLLRRRMRRVA